MHRLTLAAALLRPRLLPSRSLAMSAVSRSPSPPSKRMRFGMDVEAQAVSDALPSSSKGVNGKPSAVNEKIASLLPAPGPAQLSTARGNAQGKNGQKQSKRKTKPVDAGGLEEIMFYEARRLLGKETVDKAVERETDYRARFDRLQEIALEIVAMSSHGTSETPFQTVLD